MDFDLFSSATAERPEKAADSSADRALPSLRIRAGQLDDLIPLMKIVTRDLSLGRQHLAVAALNEAVKGRGAESITSTVAVRDETVVGGAIATRIADDAAQLIGFGCHDSVAPAQRLALVRSLSDTLHQRLRARGFQFVQASCDPADSAPRCAEVGYAPIARLDYLDSNVDALLDSSAELGASGSSSCWQARGLHCLPIDPSESAHSWQRMVKLVQSTYEQTLDCPRLNAFRSAADVVGAYVSGTSFQPDGWRMISDRGRDIACLVTVVQPRATALELTYMGIAPSHRGRGIGRLLVREAARIAKEKAAERVVLAVDQANRPACDVYRQCGFASVGSEAVWGRKLAPTASS